MVVLFPQIPGGTESEENSRLKCAVGPGDRGQTAGEAKAADILNIVGLDGTRIFICDEMWFSFEPSDTHMLAAKSDKKVYELKSDSRKQITKLQVICLT